MNAKNLRKTGEKLLNKDKNEELKEQKKEAIEYINIFTKGRAITELNYNLFEVKSILGGDE